MIIIAMFDPLPVHVNAIIVILGVHDQASPFPPTGGDVRPIILVQILAEVA